MLKSKIAAVLYAASLGSREKLSHTTHFGLSSIFTCMSCPICLIYSSTNSSNFCKVRAAVSSSSEYVFFKKKTHAASSFLSLVLITLIMPPQLTSQCQFTARIHICSLTQRQQYHIKTVCAHIYMHVYIINTAVSFSCMHACMRCNDMIKNGWWYNSERGISRRERERRQLL